MCTLAVLWKCHPAAPLVVAQCRDELLDRPALDVERWRTAPSPAGHGVDVVSGRDALAGGTWFGVGPRVIAALTNRRDALGPRRGTRSRGELVVRALEAGNVADVERDLAGRDAAAYGPFSFLACDGDELIYTDNATSSLAVRRVAPGVHVLGNRTLDNPEDPVVRTVGAAARELVDAGLAEDALVDGLRAILGRHGEGWPCVHLPDFNYGTRSAGVLVWRPPTSWSGASSSRLWTHPSAPHDATQWRDSTPLLAGL